MRPWISAPRIRRSGSEYTWIIHSSNTKPPKEPANYLPTIEVKKQRKDEDHQSKLYDYSVCRVLWCFIILWLLHNLVWDRQPACSQMLMRYLPNLFCTPNVQSACTAYSSSDVPPYCSHHPHQHFGQLVSPEGRPCFNVARWSLDYDSMHHRDRITESHDGASMPMSPESWCFPCLSSLHNVNTCRSASYSWNYQISSFHLHWQPRAPVLVIFIMYVSRQMLYSCCSFHLLAWWKYIVAAMTWGSSVVLKFTSVSPSKLTYCCPTGRCFG